MSLSVPQVSPPVPATQGIGEAWQGLWKDYDHIVGIGCLKESTVLDIIVAYPAASCSASVEVEVKMASDLAGRALVRDVEVSLAGHALPTCIPIKKLILVEGSEFSLKCLGCCAIIAAAWQHLLKHSLGSIVVAVVDVKGRTELVAIATKSSRRETMACLQIAFLHYLLLVCERRVELVDEARILPRHNWVAATLEYKYVVSDQLRYWINGPTFCELNSGVQEGGHIQA